MTWRLWLVPALLVLSPSAGWAVSKEIVQLQREMALLQDAVRTLQHSVHQRMGAVQALLEQNLDRVNELHASNAAMQGAVSDRLEQQEDRIGRPMVTLGVKLDQAAREYIALRDLLGDVSLRLRGLERRLADLEATARPAPPVTSLSEALGGPPDGVTAQGLFTGAMRDQLAGNYDLALEQYHKYLEYFGNTELAASSLFHIGEIEYYQGHLDRAIETLDRVISQYPKSGKAADALYLKAQALKKQGKRSQAEEEMGALVRRYPGSDAAKRVPVAADESGNEWRE